MSRFRFHSRPALLIMLSVWIPVLSSTGCALYDRDGDDSETPAISPTPAICTSSGQAPLGLLVNGSAENGLDCWKNDGDFATGTSSTAAYAIPADGTHYFFGGFGSSGPSGPATSGTLWQTVNLEQSGVSLADVDAGHMVVIGGGYQKSFRQPDEENDSGSITIIAYSGDGAELNTMHGPDIQASNWTYTRISSPLPPGTRQVVYKFTALRISGEDNDACLDSAFLWIDIDMDGDGSGPATGDCDDSDPRVSALQPGGCEDLLVNPGAEAALTGWTASPTFMAVPSSEAEEGHFYFSPGLAASAMLSQTVDLVASGYSTDTLDAGHLTLVAGGYQRAPITNLGAPGQVIVDVRDAGGETLQTIKGALLDNISSWQYSEAVAPLPAGARSLIYVFQAGIPELDPSSVTELPSLDGAFLRLE